MLPLKICNECTVKHEKILSKKKKARYRSVWMCMIMAVNNIPKEDKNKFLTVVIIGGQDSKWMTLSFFKILVFLYLYYFYNKNVLK